MISKPCAGSATTATDRPTRPRDAGDNSVPEHESRSSFPLKYAPHAPAFHASAPGPVKRRSPTPSSSRNLSPHPTNFARKKHPSSPPRRPPPAHNKTRQIFISRTFTHLPQKIPVVRTPHPADSKT